MSTTNSSSINSNRSSISHKNSNDSQTSRAVSSHQRPQGLSSSTKNLAKQLRQSEREIAASNRMQFFNGGLAWLMEQTIEAESSVSSVRRRRGSLLTEQAVKMHDVSEGGRRSLGREDSNSSSGSSSSELSNSSEAEFRIDAWVSQQTNVVRDPPQ